MIPDMHAGAVVRALRLVSGLVPMALVAGRLANLAIGFHSLAAMGAWRAHLMDPWRTGLGQWRLLHVRAQALKRRNSSRPTNEARCADPGGSRRGPPNLREIEFSPSTARCAQTAAGPGTRFLLRERRDNRT